MPFKIGELKISCQLYKNSNSLQKEKENKENFMKINMGEINEKININNDIFLDDATNSQINNDVQTKNNLNIQMSNIQQSENTKQIQNYDEINYEELKLDFDDFLILHIKISHLVPVRICLFF